MQNNMLGTVETLQFTLLRFHFEIKLNINIFTNVWLYHLTFLGETYLNALFPTQKYALY